MNNVNKLYHFLTIAAVTAALAACSADDVQEATQPASAPQALTFQVEDQGMKPLQGTRAIDNKDYTKQMLAGDAIGVFRVEQVGGNWTVTAVNVKYVLNENGQWDYQATGDAILTGPESDTGFQSDPTDHNAPIIYYFAYYPYQGSDDTFAIANGDYSWADAVTAATAASGGSDAAVAQARAEGFFKGLIAKWRPKHDQSTQAKYSNQDLMVAAATVNNDNTVVFQMAHQMAMVEIRFAQVFGGIDVEPKYRFRAADDYYQGLDFSTGNEGTQSQKNIYRLIVRPKEVVSIQGDIYNPNSNVLVSSNPNWYVTTSNQLAKGQYQVFGTASVTSTVKTASFNLGNILYSDGTFQTSLVSGHGTPVGIVVYKNKGASYSSNVVSNSNVTVNGDKICEKDNAASYSSIKIAGRGLIMVLEDLKRGTNEYGFIWGGENANESNDIFPDGMHICNPTLSYNGLLKTNYLIGNGTTGTCGHTNHEFCKALYSWRNQSAHAVPVGCSDWFVGSATQWNELFKAMYEGLSGHTGTETTNVGTWQGISCINTSYSNWKNLYGSIRKALVNAGGTMMVIGSNYQDTNGTASDQRYWIMEEINSNSGTTIYCYDKNSFNYGYDTGGNNEKYRRMRVRPILAF